MGVERVLSIKIKPVTLYLNSYVYRILMVACNAVLLLGCRHTESVDYAEFAQAPGVIQVGKHYLVVNGYTKRSDQSVWINDFRLCETTLYLSGSKSCKEKPHLIVLPFSTERTWIEKAVWLDRDGRETEISVFRCRAE